MDTTNMQNPLHCMSASATMLYMESLERGLTGKELTATRRSLGFRTIGSWKGNASRGKVKRRKAFNAEGCLKSTPA